jgi:ankyrin repeat protein
LYSDQDEDDSETEIITKVINLPQNLPPLLKETATRNRARVADLLSSGVLSSQTTRDGITALHICADINEVDIAQLLLDGKADMNSGDKENRRPLAIAILARSIQVACLLIQRGCSLWGFPKLAADIFEQDEYTIRQILKQVALVSTKDQHLNMVCLAIERNDTKFLKALLDEGFDLNEEDIEGMTELKILQPRQNIN